MAIDVAPKFLKILGDSEGRSRNFYLYYLYSASRTRRASKECTKIELIVASSYFNGETTGPNCHFSTTLKFMRSVYQRRNYPGCDEK